MAPAEEVDAAWIRKLRNGGATPLRAAQGCAHGWAMLPGNMFQVRGPCYLETRKKIAGGEPVLQPLAFDWIKSSAKIFNIMKHPHGRVRQALEEAMQERRRRNSIGKGGMSGDVAASRSDDPFVWAINFQVPSKDNHSLVFYYVCWGKPEKGSLMERFVEGDAAFRNGRLKLLANVAAGPWIVKKAVGERGGGAVLLGKAVSCVYNRDAHFMEIDVDIGASLVANAVVHLAFASVTSLTVDLAFVLEAKSAAELPERILATIRFADLDPSAATYLPPATATHHHLLLPPPPSSSTCSSSLSPTGPAAASPSFWRRSFTSLLHAPHHHQPVANVEDDDDDNHYAHPHYYSDANHTSPKHSLSKSDS